MRDGAARRHHHHLEHVLVFSPQGRPTQQPLRHACESARRGRSERPFGARGAVRGGQCRPRQRIPKHVMLLLLAARGLVLLGRLRRRDCCRLSSERAQGEKARSAKGGAPWVMAAVNMRALSHLLVVVGRRPRRRRCRCRPPLSQLLQNRLLSPKLPQQFLVGHSSEGRA